MTPFYFLLHFLNELHSCWFWIIYFFCSFGTCCLIIRGIFQFNFSKPRFTYFKIYSNQIEIVLIMLSVIILVFIWIPEGTILREDVLTWSSTLMLLVGKFELLLLISSFPSTKIHIRYFVSLIFGLVIDDIQNFRKKTMFLLLQYQIENSIETSNVKREIQEYIER